jgi:multiple sugar transport system permease protein
MKVSKKALLGWYIVLIILLIFALFPIYWMFITSLKSFREVYFPIPTFWPKKIEWSNYTKIFSRYDYGIALFNSLKVSVTVAILSVIVSIFSAYSVVRLKFFGKMIMPQLFLLSYLIPRTILFIPIYIFITRIGLADSIWGLILTYPTITIPYATWVLITYFQNLPIEIEEAALVDGASRVQTILQIILPISLPSIVATLIFSFTLCWSEYIYALVIINNKFQRTITLALSSMLVADIIPWGPLMAGAVLSTVPVLIFYLLASKYIISGLTLGAVKG